MLLSIVASSIMKVVPFVRYLIIAVVMFVSDAAVAQKYGLNTQPPTKSEVVRKEIKITNMPMVRNQGSVGLCAPVAASAILDEAQCVSKNIAECATVPDSQRTSPLDLSRYSKNLDERWDEYDAYDGLQEGGWTARILENVAMNVMAVVPEACAPYDQFAAGITDPKVLKNSVYKRFEDVYNNNRNCDDCGKIASDLRKIGVKISDVDFRDALVAPTYDKFLDRLFIPAVCRGRMVRFNEHWELIGFPVKQDPLTGQSEEEKYNQTLAKIRSIVGEAKRPMTMTFCGEVPLVAKTMRECSAGHDLVVKGYRQVCSKDGRNCRNQIQVHNSWGERWQQLNDDGWVDARELLNRTFYEKFSLSWLRLEKP